MAMAQGRHGEAPAAPDARQSLRRSLVGPGNRSPAIPYDRAIPLDGARPAAAMCVSAHRGRVVGVKGQTPRASDRAAARVLKQCDEGLDVCEHQRAAPPLQQAGALERLQLARHRLAAGADAGRDFSVIGRRRDEGAAGHDAVRPAEAQELGEQAVTDVERGELAHAVVERTRAASSASSWPQTSTCSCTTTRNSADDMRASVALVSATTLAERGRLSIAASSPKNSPLPMSPRITSRTPSVRMRARSSPLATKYTS